MKWIAGYLLLCAVVAVIFALFTRQVELKHARARLDAFKRRADR
jgi:predicted outer membrane lipoprotein